jgi:glycosyltransferase involved in cell wall biosynthesis
MTEVLSTSISVGEALRQEFTAVVISNSLLSSEFRARLEARIGTRPGYLLLSSLRRLPLRELISTLRSIRARQLYLPIEDDDAAIIRPILECTACLTRARAIFVLDAELQQTRVRRLSAAVSAAGLALASIDGARRRRAVAREVRALLNAKRTPPAPIARGEVVYLNTNLWFGVKAGGSVGHVAGVANALHRSGWPVRYVSVAGAAMLDSTIECERLPALRAFGMPPEINLYRYSGVAYSSALELLRRRRPAFIYQRMSVGNFLGAQLSHTLKIPLVLEYNGSEVWAARHWARAMRYESLAAAAEDVCLHHAQVIVTISEVLRDELVDRGVEPERIVWYPNCIDPQLFTPDRFSPEERGQLRRQYDLTPDDIVITFVGTFGKWHGVDVLAAAVGELVESQAQWLDQHRVRFLFVGDGLHMPTVRQHVDTPAAAPYARLAGLVPQHLAALHLAASDIVVSPHVPNADGTRFFGSPTKLFEYMAMGRPIIASDLDQIGEVLRPAIRAETAPAMPQPNEPALAVLCKPGNRDDLKRAIRFVVEHPEWRAHLGACARAAALSKYTWERHVRAILEKLPIRT